MANSRKRARKDPPALTPPPPEPARHQNGHEEFTHCRDALISLGEDIERNPQLNARIYCLPPSIVDDQSEEEDLDEEELLNEDREECEGLIETVGTVEVVLEEDEEDYVLPSTTDNGWTKNLSLNNVFNVKQPVDIVKEYGDDLKEKSPLELFNLFIPPEHFTYVTEQCNLYRRQNNWVEEIAEITEDEVRNFIALQLYSGYQPTPREELYWSKNVQHKNDFVRSLFPRNRYRQIKRCFHMADNDNLKEEDKYAKVRPLYDLLNQKLVQFGTFHKNLAIDESMCPYCGRCSCKVYIKMKPIKFGYKLFVICSSDGYPYKVIPYPDPFFDPKQPQHLEAVKRLLAAIDPGIDVDLYFDSFYSSPAVFKHCTELGIGATGTAQPNRFPVPGLATVPIIKKQPRGTFDYMNNNKVHVTRWMDSKPVTVVSNKFTHEPVGSILKWTKKVTKGVKKSYQIPVAYPNVFERYNEYMGGVDVMDKLLSSYRPKIQGKKWYYNLEMNAYNIAMVAAFKLYQALYPKPKVSVEERKRLQLERQQQQEEEAQRATKRRRTGSAKVLRPTRKKIEWVKPKYWDHLTFRVAVVDELAIFGTKYEDEVKQDLNKMVPVVTGHTLKSVLTKSRCIPCYNQHPKKEHWIKTTCPGCLNKRMCKDAFDKIHKVIE